MYNRLCYILISIALFSVITVGTEHIVGGGGYDETVAVGADGEQIIEQSIEMTGETTVGAVVEPDPEEVAVAIENSIVSMNGNSENFMRGSLLTSFMDSDAMIEAKTLFGLFAQLSGAGFVNSRLILDLEFLTTPQTTSFDITPYRTAIDSMTDDSLRALLVYIKDLVDRSQVSCKVLLFDDPEVMCDYTRRWNIYGSCFMRLLHLNSNDLVPGKCKPELSICDSTSKPNCFKKDDMFLTYKNPCIAFNAYAHHKNILEAYDEGKDVTELSNAKCDECSEKRVARYCDTRNGITITKDYCVKPIWLRLVKQPEYDAVETVSIYIISGA